MNAAFDTAPYSYDSLSDDEIGGESDGGAAPPPTTEATATLPIPAARAFELFADVERLRLPEWLNLIQSVRVLRRDADAQPVHVAFLARQQRSTLGYSLHYDYDLARRRVAWWTGPDAGTQLTGRARFTPLGAEACLMEYRVSIRLPTFAAWQDPRFTNHAASAVVAAFRDHLRR
jgi:hypothetical protein